MKNLLEKYTKTCMGSNTISSVNLSPESEPPSAPQQKTKRFRIEKWEPMIMWSWKLNDDVCVICKCDLNQSCIECLATITEESCDVVLSECNHAFHKHCIDKWLKARQVCPLDNTDWSVKKTFKVGK